MIFLRVLCRNSSGVAAHRLEPRVSLLDLGVKSHCAASVVTRPLLIIRLRNLHSDPWKKNSLVQSDGPENKAALKKFQTVLDTLPDSIFTLDEIKSHGNSDMRFKFSERTAYDEKMMNIIATMQAAISFGNVDGY